MGVWDDYVPTPQWATNRPVVVDGAQPTAEEWRVTQEDIYDRLEYLFDGNNEETMVRCFGLVDMVFDQTQWEIDHVFGCVQQIGASGADAAANCFVYVRIRVPDGARISSISARVDPSNTHGGSLPAQLPRWTLYRQNLNSPGFGTPENRGAVTDSSGTVAAYEAAHSITRTFSAPNEVVDNDTYAYWVRFEGESGTPSETNLKFYGVQVAFTTTRRDGGAA